MRTLRTVTLNSGFDDTFTVSDVEWGGVARVQSYESLPAGKGVNAARTASALGLPVCAYALVGGDDLEIFSARLEDEGIAHRLVAVPGHTRHNLTVAPASGERVAAHMVGEGFRLSNPSTVVRLVDTLVKDCQPGDMVTFNGSLPYGVSETCWSEAAERLRAAGVVLASDVQGVAMLHLLESHSVVFAKPNESEIAALPGIQGHSAETVEAALRSLASYGVVHPLVTLGARGAAFLEHGQVYIATCPVDRPVRAVGAGDAFMAGACSALLAGHLSTTALVSAGLAAASAHVSGSIGQALAESARQNNDRVRIVRA